jgi:hypothetical protein
MFFTRHKELLWTIIYYIVPVIYLLSAGRGWPTRMPRMWVCQTKLTLGVQNPNQNGMNLKSAFFVIFCIKW